MASLRPEPHAMLMLMPAGLIPPVPNMRMAKWKTRGLLAGDLTLCEEGAGGRWREESRKEIDAYAAIRIRSALCISLIGTPAKRLGHVGPDSATPDRYLQEPLLALDHSPRPTDSSSRGPVTPQTPGTTTTTGCSGVRSPARHG